MPVPTGVSIPPSPAPTRAASPARICHAPDTLTGLSVTRTDEFPENEISFVLPDHVTSSDAFAVAEVARTACQLPILPSGRFCPEDFGVTYALTFMAGTTPIETVTGDPAGCPSLMGLGPTRAAGPSLWDELAVALGLPAPREYCDPFRGRLPTAPTQCGPLL